MNNSGISTAPQAPGRRTLLKAGAVGVAAGAIGLPRTADAQRGGGRMVYANGSPYDTLDPHKTFDVGRVAGRINMYDSLLRWLDNPPKLNPWLAESFTVSDDGQRYTFKLRPGVKFHDGAELTSADVVYSMERILALKQGAYGLFAPLVEPGSTKAPDKLTVEFKLPFATGTYWDIAAKELADLAEGPRKTMGHACEFETSMVLALRPELVRREEIRDDPPPSEPALRGLYICEDMHQRTDHGAVGYPERASAEKGRACLKAAIDRTGEVVQALLQRPLPQ